MAFGFGKSRPTARASRRSVRLCLEVLENRLAPAFALNLVALHEFGHSLGLAHTSDGSILDGYYNAGYNLNNFNSAQDSAVANLQTKLANGTFAWKDALDPHPNNGVIEITYSFMPDGAKLDSGARNTLFATMNAKFPGTNWQQIFVDQLDRWASVSGGKLLFTKVADGGQPFNVSGQLVNGVPKVQNDSRFGDIRIGAHRFDGIGKILAHAYYPPPNGASAAGDAHFDQAEDWVATAPPQPLTTQPAGSTGEKSTKPIEGQSDNLELGGEVAMPPRNDGMQLAVVEGLRTAVPVIIRFDLAVPTYVTANAPLLIAAPQTVGTPSSITWYTDPAQLEEPTPVPMEQERAPMEVQATSAANPTETPLAVVARFDDLYEVPASDLAPVALIEIQGAPAPFVEPYADADGLRVSPGVLTALAAMVVGGASPWLAKQDSREEKRNRRPYHF